MPLARPTALFGASSLLVALLVTASVRAADLPYVGTWASDLAQCNVAQERQEAPLVLSKNGYDQHETHCKFASVEGADGDWKVKSNCTVEGDAQPYDFTLTVSGDTLTVTDEYGSRDLLRCR